MLSSPATAWSYANGTSGYQARGVLTETKHNGDRQYFRPNVCTNAIRLATA